jgi:hypothetical protein
VRCKEYPTLHTSLDVTAAASFNPLSLAPTLGEATRVQAWPFQRSVSVRRMLLILPKVPIVPGTVVVPTAHTSLDEIGAIWLRMDAPPGQRPLVATIAQPLQGPRAGELAVVFDAGLAGRSRRIPIATATPSAVMPARTETPFLLKDEAFHMRRSGDGQNCNSIDRVHRGGCVLP